MIISNVNVTKLHEEFINKGIFPEPVLTKVNGDGDFTFAEGVDMQAVQQIIDAHDTTPSPAPLTEIELVKLSQAEQFETILEILGGLM